MFGRSYVCYKKYVAKLVASKNALMEHRRKQKFSRKQIIHSYLQCDIWQGGRELYKELTSRRSGDFVCLLIRVSRVRTPDRALLNHCFCRLRAAGMVIFLLLKRMNINLLYGESALILQKFSDFFRLYAFADNR